MHLDFVTWKSRKKKKVTEEGVFWRFIYFDLAKPSSAQSDFLLLTSIEATFSCFYFSEALKWLRPLEAPSLIRPSGFRQGEPTLNLIFCPNQLHKSGTKNTLL